MRRILWAVPFLISFLPTVFIHRLVAQSFDQEEWSTLLAISSRAGYIFAGTVLAVERSPDNNHLATVQIHLRVDQAVRGVRTGQIFTLREWAGLWEAGERYRRGERVALFLYPTSRLGLTSPVGGPQGRLAIDRGGKIVMPSPPSGKAGGPASGASDQGAKHLSPREFARVVSRASEE